MTLTAFLAKLMATSPALVREALSADSLEGRADQLRAAWRVISPSYDWYVCDVFDDAVIVRNDGTEYLRIPYTVTADTITFGTPEKVTVQYEPVGEACIRILEATGDKTGASWRVRVLRFGRSENGWYWTRESGEALLPHLAHAPVGAYVYAGVAAHAQEEAVLQADGAVMRNVVGDISNPALEPDGVYADLHIHEDAGWLRTKLLGLEARGVLDKVIGLSIDTLAGYVPVQLREGAAKAIKSIQRVFSVDVVTAPSADGRFLRATAGPLLITTTQEDVMNRDQLLALIRESRPALLEGKDIVKLTEAEVAALVREALKTPPTIVVPVAAAVDEPQWLKDHKADIARRDTAVRVSEALAGAATLPEPVKAKVRKRFDGQVATAEVVAAIVKEEIDTLAALSLSGEPHAPHAPGAVLVAPRDKVQAAMDRLFEVDLEKMGRALESAPMSRYAVARITESLIAPVREAHKDRGLEFRSLRHAYVQITGDEDVSGLIRKGRASEAIENSTWADILGNTLYRRLLATYAEPMYGEKTLARFGSAPDFRTRETTILHYFGDLSTVDPETADYTEITAPADDKVSYAVTQKGNILTITRKVIINDDLRAVALLVGRLGRSARRTLAQLIWNFWINNSAYDVDAVAWHNTAHANTGTTALTADLTGAREVFAKWTQLAAMTEQGSSKKLGRPRREDLYLAVPADLFRVATEINTSKEFGTGNVNPCVGMFGANGERLVEVLLTTDATDWGVHVSPAGTDRESIQIDFLQGREEPEFFLADQPTVGQAFLGDKIQYKIRHEYGGDITDFRGSTRNVVAA